MASRRFTIPDMPVQQCSLRNAPLFQEDINFLKSKGQHPCTIVRESLHIYCDAWRTAQYLLPMTKEERDAFILARVPCMKILHTRPDPAVYATVIQNPVINTARQDPIKRVEAYIMRDWSKGQRDAYIMYGSVP